MKKFLISILLIIIIILIPFGIEQILINEDIFPFNITIHFSKDIWFSFLASYIGAVGTIFLGLVALYQNKKYKDLSDRSEEQFLAIQNEIKTLTQKSVELIELNSKIEHARYYPILTDLRKRYLNMDMKSVQNNFDINNDSFQITYELESLSSIPKAYDEIFNQTNTFSFVLKNDGEMTIKNFNCKEVIINNDDFRPGIRRFSSCDIEPGNLLICVYSTKQKILEQIKKGTMRTITFKYNMENVLGKHFQMSVDITFTNDEQSYPIWDMEISPISKID